MTERQLTVQDLKESRGATLRDVGPDWSAVVSVHAVEVDAQGALYVTLSTPIRNVGGGHDAMIVRRTEKGFVLVDGMAALVERWSTRKLKKGVAHPDALVPLTIYEDQGGPDAP